MTEHDDEPAAARRLVLTPASNIRMRPVIWAWDTSKHDHDIEGRFPAGSMVIAAGRAGLGKSQFAAWTAAHITTGTLPGCWQGTPRNVIYAASEDSWEMTITPRLAAAGADLERVFRIDVVDDGEAHARLTLPSDTSLLERLIRDNDVALMVLDPLLSMIDGGINDYRAREVRQALEPLVAVADRTRSLMLGLAHFTKASGTDPLTLISGSGAFGQLIRAAIGFAQDEESEDGTTFVLSQIKNNLGREDVPSLSYVIDPATIETDDGPSHVSRIKFTGESTKTVRDILRATHANSTDSDRGDRDEAAQWLTSYLEEHGGSAPARDIFKAARADGIPERTLKRGRERAGIESERKGFGGGSVWSIRATLGPFVPTPERGTNGPNEGPNDCRACGFPLNPALATEGETTHPACAS